MSGGIPCMLTVSECSGVKNVFVVKYDDSGCLVPFAGKRKSPVATVNTPEGCTSTLLG